MRSYRFRSSQLAGRFFVSGRFIVPAGGRANSSASSDYHGLGKRLCGSGVKCPDLPPISRTPDQAVWRYLIGSDIPDGRVEALTILIAFDFGKQVTPDMKPQPPPRETVRSNF